VAVPVERGFGTGFFPSGFPYAAPPSLIEGTILGKALFNSSDNQRNGFEGHLEVFVDFLLSWKHREVLAQRGG
jgi:hypothetical protein